ncbi:MAG: hypothetical protein JXB49_16095 [Bacteroidales bacterium]|nr:hypothetical protein [Bacteroidales bacterium]
MKFKRLELEPESNWIKRTMKSKHFIRTFVYTLIGALSGFLLFYFGIGRHMNVIETGDIVKSILTGAFFGIFITNSPCVRGRC